MSFDDDIVEHSRRLEAFVLRDERRAEGAPRRRPRRGTAALARRITNIGMALAALIVGTIIIGIINPIGIGGLFVVMALAILAILFFAVWPGERPRKVAPFRDDMPNQAVVRRLDALLHNQRHALPAPAAVRADAIGRQLPLLESRLGELDPLDPLAQDARRLMGRHLPELIERYERVPAQLRNERDGEGLSVDERLIAGLDAAHEALKDLGAKLVKEDVDALHTQGRFLETRYKDDPGFGGTTR
ncbi:MAG: hypothetical protein ACK4K7_14000 [Allosphingosinicella sp.]|uniref:hypothetical protein n=1 Tax=Allosphingosinicella sp. TaxID=2823234 RepID=UPI00395E2120